MLEYDNSFELWLSVTTMEVNVSFLIKVEIVGVMKIRADNELIQLNNSSEFDLTINSLNLVHESNELNLS
jgi:hypothetical protein